MALIVGAASRADDGPDFRTEVVPVLTKTGCNSAACHGAAIGRGGLRLSLLGYDPDLDYSRLAHEYRGRRVNLHDADRSLVLKKASRQIRHGGGERLPIKSEGYKILRDWIASGTITTSPRSLTKLDVSPSQTVLKDIGDSCQLKVTATFSDGTTDDVTRWTVFESNDKQALSSDESGKVTALRRGQNSVMIRFLDSVDSVIVTVPLENQKPALVADLPRFNYVDEHINRTLSRLRMDSSPQASDSAYLRRVCLDLTGSLPTPRQMADFNSNSRSNKRSDLVRQLLESDDFVDHWTYIWGDLLQVESRRLGQPGAEAFHQWLRDRIARNVPLDEMARELLLAQGDAFKNGAANFHRVPSDAREQAEYVSRVFLGVRLQCANCHNHPLDRWTQDDYHGLAAVFAKVRRNQVVTVGERGDVIHPKTKQPALPRIPGERFIGTQTDSHIELANWITASDNPFFARAAANRIWRELMGRGLVEPVDDHRASNPATHPALLDQLADEFASSGFDIRKLISTIVLSAAYQRSSISTGNNRVDDRFYAKAMVRQLSPTVMVDAVSAVTGVAEEFGSAPKGTKAIELGDSRVRSEPLDLLGRCDRATSCGEAESAGVSSLPLTLHVINGDWINSKIENSNSTLSGFLKSNLSNEQIVTKIYQLAYSREPTTGELKHWSKKFTGLDKNQRAAVLNDFMWAVVNSSEFSTNH